MIFVTVGTHEQSFERLVKHVDYLKKNDFIQEKVILQTGYCKYKPQYCEWSFFFSYEQMQNLISQARITITHGGPSSFIMPLQMGKIPIVVPRQKKYGEHINDHQIDFVQKVAMKMNNIIPVINIEDLKKTIINYDNIIGTMLINPISNNQKFIYDFERIVNELMS